MAEQLPDYESILRDRMAAQGAAATQAPALAPDQAATTLRNSIKENTSFSVGASDPQFNAQAQEAENARTAHGDPNIQRYLADNDFAASVSSDDLDNLSVVGKTLEALRSGYRSGELTGRLGTVAAGYQVGLGPLPAEAQEILKEQRAQPQFSGGYWAAQSLASFVGNLVHAGIGPAGVTGAAVGAAAGATGGPLSGITVPIGTLGGWAYGTLAKVAMDAAVSKYLELDQEVSPSGEKVPEYAKQAASVAVGLVNFYGLRYGAGAAATEFTKELLTDAVRQPTVARTLSRLVSSTAEAGAVGGTINLGMEFVNSVAGDLAKYAASPEFQTILNDPAKREEFRQNLLTSFALGAGLAGTLHFPLQGVSVLNDMRLIREAKNDAQNYQDAFKALRESKTLERSPEAFEAFVKGVAGDSTVGIPVDAIKEIYGDKIGDNFGWLPDFQERLERADSTGGDVTVPLEKWLTAPEEVQKALKDDIRLRDEGLTTNEATQLEDLHARAADLQRAQEAKAFEETQKAGPELYTITDPLGAEKEGETIQVQVLRAKDGRPEALYTDKGIVKIAPAYQGLSIEEAIAHSLGDHPMGAAPDVSKVKKLDEAGAYERAEKKAAALPEPGAKEVTQNPYRAATAETGVPYIDAVLRSPITNRNINKPNVIRDYDVPYVAGGSTPLENPDMFIDRHFPKKITVNGKTFDPAEPFTIHENIEQHVMEELVKAGWDHQRAYKTAHWGWAEPAEAAWYAKKGIDRDAAEAEYAKHYNKIQHENPENPPPNLYKDPYPHDSVTGAAGEKSVEVEKPTPADIAEAAQIVMEGLTPAERLALPAPEAIAKQEMWLEPLFRDGGKTIGMTEAEFKLYNKKLEALDKEAQEREVARKAKEVAKRQTQEWKANEAETRKEVINDLSYRPDFLADEFFRSGKIGSHQYDRVRLDRAEIEETYGKDFADQLPPRVTVAKGGVSPNDISSVLGFNSGGDLVRALFALEKARGDLSVKEYFKQVVDREVAERMEDRYGDLNKNILAEAREQVGSGGQADLLANEMFLLAGRLPSPLELDRAKVDKSIADVFDNTPAKDARKVSAYVRAVGKAGQEAQMALLKGDIPKAFQAKQRQLYAFEQMRKAQKFSRLADQLWKLKESFSDQTRSSYDQAHTDQIHKILDRVGLGREFPLPADTPTLKEFVQNSNGQIAAAHWLLDDGLPPKNYEKMNVAEITALTKTLQSIAHAGREEKKISSIYKTAELENVVFDSVEALKRFALVHNPLSTIGVRETVKNTAARGWRSVVAGLLPLDRAFDYTDKFDPKGPLSQFVSLPLRQAGSKERVLQEQVVKRLRALEEHVDSSINDRIDNKLIKDPGDRTGFLTMTRHNLRILMANMGTESNIDKMVRGFNLGEFGDDALVDFVNRHATEKDWKWVKGIWDIFKYLKPEADAMQLRVTGVPVDELPLRSFATKFGQSEGGYFPMMYDKERSNIVNDIAGKIFDKHYTPATTPHGWTETRTGYAAPVDLNGTLLKNKIAGMVHDIAFREAVINADRLFRHEEFYKAFREAWGPELAKQLRPMLQDIANVHNVDDAFLQGAVKYIAAVRQNTISALIFLGPGTFLKHGTTALGLSASEVGTKNFLKGVKEFGIDGAMGAARDLIKSPEFKPPTRDFVEALSDVVDAGPRGESTRQFILDSSPFMRGRQSKYYDTIQGAYERTVRSGAWTTLLDARHGSMNIGRFPVAFSDAISAFPTWLQAYKKAMAEGSEHSEAVLLGDKAVVNAHGSLWTQDLPPALRQKNEFMKWFTSLYHFWNRTFANQIQWGWDAAALVKGRDEPRANIPSLSQRVFWLAVVPIVIEEMAGAAITDDHRGLGRRALDATVRHFGAGLPFVRELTNGFAHGYEPSVGMISTVTKTMYTAATDFARWAQDQKVSDNWLTHMTQAMGMMTGIGGPQVGRTGTFIKDWVSGEDVPETFNELRQGLRTGHTRPSKGH